MKSETVKLIFDVLATILSSAAIFIYMLQLLLQRKSIKDDHERSRREKGVDILHNWFSTLDKNNSTARKLAENLSEENLLSIYHCEGFTLPYSEKNAQYCIVLFGKDNSDLDKSITNKEDISISSQQATEIRWQLISYLNDLENVVVAWKYNIVDRNLIEAEFKYMFDHKGGALKKFREIMVDAYPCIDLFELKMKDKYTAKICEDFKELGK